MSLRIYFYKEKLQQHPGLHDWSKTPIKESGPLDQTERDSWSHRGIFNLRLRHDDQIGLPYLQLDNFRTIYIGSEGINTLMLQARGLIKCISITDTWTGEQKAEYIYGLLGNVQYRVAISRYDKSVHLEMTGWPIGNEPFRFVDEMLRAYELVRQCKLREAIQPDDRSMMSYATDVLPKL